MPCFCALSRLHPTHSLCRPDTAGSHGQSMGAQVRAFYSASKNKVVTNKGKINEDILSLEQTKQATGSHLRQSCNRCPSSSRSCVVNRAPKGFLTSFPKTQPTALPFLGTSLQ